MAQYEPSVLEMQDWASGQRNVCLLVVAQHINWAYAYLGFDDPNFEGGEPVINEAICKMTVACRLRLSELGYEW